MTTAEDKAKMKRAAALAQLKMNRGKEKRDGSARASSVSSNASAATRPKRETDGAPSKYFARNVAPPASSQLSASSIVLVPGSSSPITTDSPKRSAFAAFQRGGLTDDLMRPNLNGRTSFEKQDNHDDTEPPHKKRNIGPVLNGAADMRWVPGGQQPSTSHDEAPRIKRAPIFAQSTVKPVPTDLTSSALPSSDMEVIEETPNRQRARPHTPTPSVPLTSSQKAASGSFSSPLTPSPAQNAASLDSSSTRGHVIPHMERVLKLFPQKSEDYLRRLLLECKGDIKELTRRIHAPAKVDTNVSRNHIKARRNVVQSPETARPRAKQSAIYQNTQASRVPAVPPSTTERIKKRRVVESDSEPEQKWSGGSDSDGDEESDSIGLREGQAVKWFNEAEPQAIVEVTACTLDQATIIKSLRPFDSAQHLRTKLTKKKGVTPRVFDDYVDILEGYAKVDSLLTRCEAVGRELTAAVGNWSDGSGVVDTSSSVTRAPSRTSPAVRVDSGDANSAALNVDIKALENAQFLKPQDEVEPPGKSNDQLLEQPAELQNLQLKDYQIYGLSWLYLLYKRDLSCILADEMGLGKTIQVIAFYAHLKQEGIEGRHLIVVPSSTLENWLREFRRFAPGINVQSYYGSQDERHYRRAELMEDEDWDVLITTYNLAQGAEADRKFFNKKIQFATCIFDEGHVLKNYQSQRYQHLMQIRVPWRLMLTGTPLQNNLQELVSLLNFLLPKYFTEAQDSLRAIFKVKADSSSSFLSRERVSRAKTMMTPFVLRRRKDQVLRDLPKKAERIEWCAMTPMQTDIYRDALQRSRKTLATTPVEEEEKPSTKSKKKAKTKAADTSTNVLMDLRKAAVHPMLFRRRFDDLKVKVIAKDCLKEPEFADSVYDLVVEDMQVMTDSELQLFCEKYKSVQKHKLDSHCWAESGKIETLLRLLSDYRSQGRRILIFSQFVQVLDILRQVLDGEGMRYLILTGSTAVDERQSLVDEFSEDESIPIFLLSTKAGGMGINLTAASVVIIFDQDFNPHNDRQAADRAYRIGQKRDVDIVKFITRGTIEEDMHKLGQTKLALDVAVAGGEEGDEDQGEKVMKTSLIGVLRKKLETDGDEAFIAGTQLVQGDEPNVLTAAEDTEVADPTTSGVS